MVGRSKCPAFVTIKELEKVVVGMEKPLSQAGREILIKAMVQSFSTYGMRFKKKKLCMHHTRMMSSLVGANDLRRRNFTS